MFEQLDGYLLNGSPSKSELVATLLAAPRATDAAGPFLEGIARLGERTPDLAILALRLALAFGRADDGEVIALRDAAVAARAGDGAARERYYEILKRGPERYG